MRWCPVSQVALARTRAYLALVDEASLGRPRRCLIFNRTATTSATRTYPFANHQFLLLKLLMDRLR